LHSGDAYHCLADLVVANGMTMDEIVRDYPYLEPEDIQQALRYAAWLSEESVHELEAVAA